MPKLADVMFAEGRAESAIIVDQLHDQYHGVALPIGEYVRIAAQVGYQLGLEVGVRIGVADVASARRFVAHFDNEVQVGDREAITGANRRAGIYLAVLDGLDT